MSLQDDATSAFVTVADIGKAFVTVGDRDRIRCLIPEGLVISSEQLTGHSRSTERATVVVSRADFGDLPNVEETALLEFGTRSIEMTVSTDEDMTETAGGALLQFPLISD
jgi:hypothetical protein|tara:strand:+ start:296 stop:625 length:330 start_codon:yes stop_codon:yes gene_type:complete